MIKFRWAEPDDAAGILEIYEPYVLESAITFEVKPPTVDEMAGRIREILPDYPYAVCLDKGVIAGYAYAHRHMARQAYDWNAELSVYLREGYTGRGLGRELYGVLLEALARQQVRNVYACVTLPNAASEKLHEYFGFRMVGVWRKTGYKLGKWRDAAWFEKAIGAHENPPPDFRPFRELRSDFSAELCASRGMESFSGQTR